MRTRKETGWRKSRRFGDVFGGRTSPKSSALLYHCHSLAAPGADQVTPILIEDNPSRDCFFPISVAEAARALEWLPKKHTSGITHLWLRRMRRSDLGTWDRPLAKF